MREVPAGQGVKEMPTAFPTTRARRSLAASEPDSISDVERALARARFSLGNGEAHDWRSCAVAPLNASAAFVTPAVRSHWDWDPEPRVRALVRGAPEANLSTEGTPHIDGRCSLHVPSGGRMRLDIRPRPRRRGFPRDR